MTFFQILIYDFSFINATFLQKIFILFPNVFWLFGSRMLSRGLRRIAPVAKRLASVELKEVAAEGGFGYGQSLLV